MILEVAILHIKSGESKAFEVDFAQAQSIISSMNGYLGHELQRCIEAPDKYILLVRWRNVADHEEGFRKSKGYLEWKQILHHYYDPFPTVEHYELVEPRVR